jgi:DNA-binding NarL/FixJ family response regulator
MSVYVVDKHPLMRHAIANLFRKLSFEMTVTEDKSIDDLISLAEVNEFPSLISMDANANVLEDIKRLKEKFPSAFIVVISEQPAAKIENSILLSGAVFYLEKSTPTEKISHVIRNLLSAIYPVKVNSQYKFTKQQIKLLQMVDKGLSNQEIANHLDVKRGSVKVKLYRLYRAIGAKNRIAAVLQAKSSGSW